jgi:hypothetical protein
MKLNAPWHKAHPMPRNATLEQRLRWHAAHAHACACRELPAALAAELKKRQATAARSGRRHR